jgi:hypothetical protein
MVDLELGQARLAQACPLQAFELAQGSVERPLEARFVAEQAIESWAIRYIATHYFQFSSGGLDRGACLLIAPEANNFFVDDPQDVHSTMPG